MGGTCPAGHYCIGGDYAPIPCPEGKYSDSTGNDKIEDCLPCPPGYFCDEKGLTQTIIFALNKVCDPGYYCTEGAVKPHPDDATGGICPAGSYCPEASPEPTVCDPGFYETRDGSDECQDCPAGFYCEGPGTTTPEECKNGYCPKRSSLPIPCPDGFYGNNDLVKMVSQEDCVFCPEGKYCQGGIIVSDCQAGYFCDFGAASKTDPSKICPKGHYCPAGTKLPIRCPDGFYYPLEGAQRSSECRPCEEGYYCIDNDSVSRICPKGHYCGLTTMEPTPCRPGTYQPEKGMGTSKDCLPCPVGFFCDAFGIADYTLWPCPKGKYCDKEAQVSNPLICPAGYYQPYDQKTS